MTLAPTLTARKSAIVAGAGHDRRQRDERAGLQEVERREERERRRPHPVHKRPVADEDSRDRQPDEIGGQDGFAPSDLGDAPEEEQDQKQELDLRLRYATRNAANKETGQARHENDGDRGGGGKPVPVAG